MAQHYKQPKRVNFVSFFLMLLGLGLSYSVFKFGPPYYRKWKTQTILSESAVRVYPKRFLSGDGESEFFNKLRQETEKQLREVGIEDPRLQVSISKTSQEIEARAEYEERIQHPFIGKSTVLHFRPFSRIKIENF